MFSVTKEFKFAYAHRIQGHRGKCCFLHGHNARVAVTCEGASLDALGMVVDFGLVKEKCGWLAELWDHKCILQEGDPLAAALEAQGCPVVKVRLPPTAEVLAREFFVMGTARGLPVSEVRFWETDTSVASCRGTGA